MEKNNLEKAKVVVEAPFVSSSGFEVPYGQGFYGLQGNGTNHFSGYVTDANNGSAIIFNEY